MRLRRLVGTQWVASPRPPPAAEIAALLVLGTLLTSLRWLELQGCWGDPARWILEAYRASRGEVMYRDFMWPYLPLPLWVAGAVIRLFGRSFQSLQVFVSVLSMTIVLLSHRLARLYLTRRWAFVAALFVLLIGGGERLAFALFSLKIYTPAILTGTIGLLLVLDAGIRIARADRIRSGHAISLSVGSMVSLLSKLEFAFAAILATAVLAAWLLAHRRERAPGEASRVSVMLVGASAPTLIVYTGIAWRVGLTQLIEGVTAYGITSLVCPWWPTGLAVLLLVMAGLQGLAVMLFLSHWGPRPVRLRWTFLVAVCALVLTGALLPGILEEWNRGRVLPLWEQILQYALSPATWRLATLWAFLTTGVWLLVRRRAGSGWDRATLEVILWMAAVVGSAARGFFGGAVGKGRVPEVPGATYAVLGVLVIVGVCYAAGEGWQGTITRSALSRLAASVAAAMLLCRASISLGKEVALPHQAVDTPIGTIRLFEAKTCRDVLHFLQGHLSANESFGDVAYGGLLHFALGRTVPNLTTMYVYYMPSEANRRADRLSFDSAPPRFVIAGTGSTLGTRIGVCEPVRCEFPALRWKTDRMACSPSEVHPLIQSILDDYEPIATFDGTTVMRRANRD